MGKLQDQIDASVFVEHLLPSKGRKKNREIVESCRKYIYRLTTGEIEGTISYPALGEIWLAIRKRVSEERQSEMLAKMNWTLHECNIRFNSPTNETLRIATDILKEDTIMKPSDALRLAETLAANNERLVTIDKELVENVVQQNKLRIKIVYPI